MATKGLRKFKFERQLGRAVMNPMVAALVERMRTAFASKPA